MAQIDSLNDLDRRLIHALQLNGRASFAQLGAVLEVPERTVSRRYHRLRSALSLRVVATLRPDPNGQEDWFVRIAPARGFATTLADSFGARSDTSWVATLSGDGSVCGFLRAPRGSGPAMIEQLRRSPRVLTVSAQRLLMPIAGIGGWPGRLGALNEREARALGGVAAESVHEIADADRPLLRHLEEDGRMSAARLAQFTKIPESTVRRRLAELEGSLEFQVEIDPQMYGRDLHAVGWLNVRPSALAATAELLRSHVEVAFAATTTGASNILVLLETNDAADLHRYSLEQLASASGVGTVTIDVVGSWVKRAGPVATTRHTQKARLGR